MTEDEKHEIATLASEAERKRRICEAHAMAGMPTDLIEAEKAMAAYAIAQTEYDRARVALSRAQKRIASAE